MLMLLLQTKDNANDNFLIFCSNGCMIDWVNEHTQDIINNRPIKIYN